jgi:hypothetical protein
MAAYKSGHLAPSNPNAQSGLGSAGNTSGLGAAPGNTSGFGAAAGNASGLGQPQGYGAGQAPTDPLSSSVTDDPNDMNSAARRARLRQAPPIYGRKDE